LGAEQVGFYEEYKPFRNYMRRFDQLASLVDVWRYSLHVIEGQALPSGYAVGMPAQRLGPLKEHLYPWDLDILARELVLNAGRGGDRDLKRWSDLATAINHIRRLDDAAFLRNPNPQDDVIFELHRMAHRQFPWQMNIGVNPMTRALKVFGQAAVESIAVRELGMTTRQFLLLGMALTASFLKNWGLSTNQDYRVLGVSKEASAAFFKRITYPLHRLKEETAERQAYGRDWLYTWNPLEAAPLIAFDPAHSDRTVCPIPRHLSRRVTSGIYYDLVRSKGFDNPFGNSFQAYVGEVIGATCRPPRFTVVAEEPYYVGTQKMHGVDWMLSDPTGHLFIESKTKRLRVDAKTHSDAVALEEDLLVMANAIVQHYRNIRDALEGKTKWVPNGLPVYPLVLTLEDWFIFSPRITETLTKHVRGLLDDENIPGRVLEEMPYTVASVHEFEIVSQVVAQTGIAAVMGKKTTPDQGRWSLLPFVSNAFKEEMREVNWRLFAEDFAALMPDPPGSSLK
jgi:hypothetical protein